MTTALLVVFGEVAEWPIVQHWKCCVRETGPRVRIPPSPFKNPGFPQGFLCFWPVPLAFCVKPYTVRKLLAEKIQARHFKRERELISRTVRQSRKVHSPVLQFLRQQAHWWRPNPRRHQQGDLEKSGSYGHIADRAGKDQSENYGHPSEGLIWSEDLSAKQRSSPGCRLLSAHLHVFTRFISRGPTSQLCGR